MAAKNVALSAFKSGLSAKKKGKHRRTKFTLPLAVVAGFVPVGVGLWNRRGSSTEMGNFLQAGFTGMSNGQFSLGNFKMGLLPVAMGFVAHSIASKLGINRAIARAGIPLIRI